FGRITTDSPLDSRRNARFLASEGRSAADRSRIGAKSAAPVPRTSDRTSHASPLQAWESAEDAELRPRPGSGAADPAEAARGGSRLPGVSALGERDPDGVRRR